MVYRLLISLDLQHIISPHTGHTLISNRVLTFISINIRLLNTVHAQYSWVSPSPRVTLPFGVVLFTYLLTSTAQVRTPFVVVDASLHALRSYSSDAG
jgi:hypothetical protein